MTRIRRGGRNGLIIAATAVLAASFGGCRDDITAPTQGRIALAIVGAADVDVYVDGEFVGTDPDTLEALPEGTYLLSAVRDCYETLPAREVTIAVRAGEIANAQFTMEAREFGDVQVRAFDELSGQEIVGAEILREAQSGNLVPTGLATPATVPDLPCGVRLQVRRSPEYADSDSRVIDIDTGGTVLADFTLGPPSAALAEMFTYVICPNCPQAAAELAAIEAAYPHEVYLIEWHTWSSLPLYTVEGEQREEYYLGSVQPGWPLVVFQGDGANWLVGSQTGTLAQYWDRVNAIRQACSNDCPVILGTESAIGGGRADVTARAKVRSGAVPGGVTLRWVLVEDDVIAPGNQPDFDAVPRAVHEQAAALAPSGQVAEWSHGVDLDPSWVEANLRWVVFLQSDADQAVLAVHGSH
ncbi:MAG TPA: hypothetical protein VKU85_19300 [bacterium]|nr:hypothetical protein [bacterium]